MNIDDAVNLYGSRDLYLRGLTDNALSERLVQCLNNCVQLSRAGQIDLCATEFPDYFQRLMDVLAETSMRHGDIASAQPLEIWDKSKNVMIGAGQSVSASISKINNLLDKKHDNILLRFGEKKYMRELYEDGGLLFQEASSFAKSDNLSVRDDELNLLMKYYVPRDQLRLIPGAPDPDAITERGVALNMQISCPDFLVLCLTNAINRRLVSDWNAEAVVVIHNPTEFRRRLARASQELAKKAGAKELEAGKVQYLDPYFPLGQPDVPFCKPYKFAYQREFRFVIRGDNNLPLEDRKLMIGSIKDIADLVEFDT